ncbi:MAG: hypothetical protein FJ404_05490 [Verrucomicrobia bacterium]|nr:hypothetical protein [Verrucomicrobiota bacterium]
MIFLKFQWITLRIPLNFRRAFATQALAPLDTLDGSVLVERSDARAKETRLIHEIRLARGRLKDFLSPYPGFWALPYGLIPRCQGVSIGLHLDHDFLSLRLSQPWTSRNPLLACA